MLYRRHYGLRQRLRAWLACSSRSWKSRPDLRSHTGLRNCLPEDMVNVAAVVGSGLAGMRACAAAALQVCIMAGLPKEAAGQLAHLNPSSLSMLPAVPAAPQHVSCQDLRLQAHSR